MTSSRHQPSKPQSNRDDQDDQQAGSTLTRRGSRRIVLVAAAIGLCAIATGVSLAAFSSTGGSPGGQAGQAGQAAGAGNSSSAGPAAGSRQPTPPVASSSTGPNVTSAGIAKTAVQVPPALKDQMLHWKEGRGGIAWSAITAQLGSLSQIAGAGLYSQLPMDCANLASSVQTARSAPPIPDNTMQRSYAKVLGGLGIASADCRSAISVHPVGDEGQQVTVNKALLNRSLAQFATETRELYTATAEIRTMRG